MKKILLGVTGSISAYKAADIANGLVKKEFDVHAVMTKAAVGFITPLTMQALTKNWVYTDVLQEQNPTEIAHISLAQQSHLILVAPATANIIGKIAAGIADDMLTSLILAVPDNIPKLIAPAMNSQMYANKIVQENLAKLQACGWEIIEPRVSRLACGDIGKGALASLETILDCVTRF
jgi:phosphopantothenoylcysteine decarboxylase